MEEDYSQRIEALLAPIVGTGRVRAQVVAQVDTASTEEAREQYRPESQIVRSEQASEETSRGGDGSQGVPGALTNQPPTPGTAQPPPAAAPKAAAGSPQSAAAAAAAAAQATANAEPSSSSKATTKNYEIDRTIAYTKTPAGKLQRLTVAVLVDNLRSQPDKAGKVTEKPLSKEQLDYMTTLVKDAVGFNQERGDSVSVVNAAFMSEPAPAPDQLESTPIWEKPVVHDFARLGAGIIILLILTLFVLRPLIRNLSSPKQAAAQLQAPPAVAGAPAAAPAMAYEQQVAQARSMVGKDPARVAQVVKTWVQANE
jgi:flagellar M-ring protein FliF